MTGKSREEIASEIEDAMELPAEVVDPALRKIAAQDRDRGSWPSPRDEAMPAPPWPATDDPMFQFLMTKARMSMEAGMDVEVVLAQLAVHAWFEGGIENYDRGQRDARRPRSV